MIRKGGLLMLLILIMVTVYYLVLICWFLNKKKNREDKIMNKPAKPCRNNGIVGKSSYAKRKSMQVNADDTEQVTKVTETVVNDSIFAPGIAEEPKESVLEKDVFVIPLDDLDKVFDSSAEPDFDVSDFDVSDFDEGDFDGDDFDEDENDSEEEEPERNVTNIDWEEEEETLSRYQKPDSNSDYASGVSYEELEKLGELISKDELQRDEVMEAGEVLNKMAGTELLESMISALPEAIERISRQIEDELSVSQGSNEKVPQWMSFDISNYL